MSAIHEKLKAHHSRQENVIKELHQKAEQGQTRILDGLTYVGAPKA
jgi:hypothetical protein